MSDNCEENLFETKGRVEREDTVCRKTCQLIWLSLACSSKMDTKSIRAAAPQKENRPRKGQTPAVGGFSGMWTYSHHMVHVNGSGAQ